MNDTPVATAICKRVAALRDAARGLAPHERAGASEAEWMRHRLEMLARDAEALAAEARRLREGGAR